MQEGAAFNWRTGIMLIAIVLAVGTYQFRDLFKTYEQLINTIKVDEHLTLYITEVSKSSLSKDTYHYYFYDSAKTSNDFLDHMSDLNPVLVTDDEKATTVVRDGQIYIRVRGNIFSFRTSGDDIRLHLDVSPW